MSQAEVSDESERSCIISVMHDAWFVTFVQLCSYHSIDGNIVIVQSHPRRAGVAVDRVIQVRVGGHSALTGETVREKRGIY